MIDVLVIGAGGAGLTAALHAKKTGVGVTVLSKSYPTRSQTSMAQGGINAALSNHGEDSTQAHIDDTLKSGQGLNEITEVTKLCSNAPQAIEWLEEIGLPFSRTQEGTVSQRQLGGARAIRACHAQDYTGLKIIHTLFDQAVNSDIDFINEHFLLNFIVEEGTVLGVTALDIRSGEVKSIYAKSVIVATGGYSKIYHDFSTNATGTTGDGIAAACRAGCHLSDIEFVQFHPTALKKSAVLISESARGEGGFLLNAKHERFTDELAPRDVVARAIYEEIKRHGEVFLDIRHLGEAFIDEALPQERKLAIAYENVDPVHDLIPIKPVAHYSMGGIQVDDRGQTTLKGLYAAGECANHNVHGANRLGGNSLLELIVFGMQAGENAAAFSASVSTSTPTLDQENIDRAFILQTMHEYTKEINFYENHALLGKVAYEKVGMFRSKKKIQELLDLVQTMQTKLPTMGVEDSSLCYNTNLVEFLEFINMLELSKVLAKGALARQESRGAHFRVDFPQNDDTHFKKHTIWKTL